MNTNKEQLWQAYIDGELSAAESAEFERSLDPEERDLLAADLRFERRLSEKLSEPEACPQEVWDRTLAKLPANRPDNMVAFSSNNRRWAWSLAALAAAVAFVISLGVTPGGTSDSPSIVLAAASVEELRARAQTGPSEQAAEEWLQSRSVEIDLRLDQWLARIQEGPHGVHLLGAGHEAFEDEEVNQLFFECCGRPIKLLIAERGTGAAMAISDALGQGGDVQAVRESGAYLLAVVSDHPAHDLLNAVDCERKQ